MEPKLFWSATIIPALILMGGPFFRWLYGKAEYEEGRNEELPFNLDNDAIIWHHTAMANKHRKTLELIFAHPPSAKVKWGDVEALFRELGAEVTEREGSRVGVRLFGERRVFHRPHPSPDADKGAVVSIRKWLEKNGVKS